jgi:hypothetical protein
VFREVLSSRAGGCGTCSAEAANDAVPVISSTTQTKTRQ